MPITAYLQLIKPLLLNADIHKTVQFLFLQYQWSPEKISFRLKHEKNPIQISYATIYRGIYRGFLEEGKLSPGQRGVARKLRHRGETRHKNGCIETINSEFFFKLAINTHATGTIIEIAKARRAI